MKNLRAWLHVCLLVSFALPWLKIPLVFTSVTVTGFLLPYQTSNLAEELSNLGVMTVSSDQMLPMYLMLIAPAISMLVLLSMVVKRPVNWYFDSIAGFIAVMTCLYVLTNTGNIIAFGLYAALILSLLLVALPLLDKERVSGTYKEVNGTNGPQSVPDTH